MAGYLEEYGAGDERRGKLIKNSILGLVAFLIVFTLGYLAFRNRAEKKQVQHFIELLRTQNYQGAYQLWGCSASNPCRDYNYQKFLEDWGPKSKHPEASSSQIKNVESCSGSVVVAVAFPKAETEVILVDRGTKVIGFAPWPECPGRHWRFGQFFRSLFGK